MRKKTVAIVGASSDRSKYSNKSIRAHADQGWTVYPVNPKGGEIEGHKVYATLADVPLPVKRVSFYVPPEIGRKLLSDVAGLDPDEFFVNPGAESGGLVDDAKQLGLEPILACSIVNLGREPDEFEG